MDRNIRRRVRREPPNPGEAGFTLVEMLIAIMIMAMIVAPLTLALVQSITLIPEARERSTAAADRRLFVNQFSDDMANRAALATNPTSSLGVPPVLEWINCNVPRSAVFQFTRSKGARWHSAGTPQRVSYDFAYGAVNGSGLYEITVTRRVESGSPYVLEDSTTYKPGFCQAGGLAMWTTRSDASAGALCPAGDKQRVCGFLTISDTSEGPVENIAFGASARL